MSTTIKRAPVATPAEQTEQKTDLDTKGERGQPQDAKTLRRLSIEMIGLAAAVVATVVMYVVFIVYPVAHEPLNEFLTTIFGRGNAAIWPMQLVWYASAAAMIGLAFWPRRLASQLICLLAAANFVWVGIVYFGVIDSSRGTLDGVINLAWLWAAIFILEAILFLVAGLVRRDLVFAPRWNLSGCWGRCSCCTRWSPTPSLRCSGGTRCASRPCLGFHLASRSSSPSACCCGHGRRRPSTCCCSLWRGLEAAPGNIAMGHVADFSLILVGAITVGLIIWRDRTSSWQTVVAGVLLAAMIALSGHDDLVIGTALVLTAVTLVQTIRGDVQQLRAGRSPQPERVLTS